MKMQTRIHFVLGLAILSFAWFAIAIFFVIVGLQAGQTKSEISKTIIQGLFELNQARADYQLDDNMRAAQQWNSRYQTFLNTLKKADSAFLSPAAKAALESIRVRLQHMRDFFGRIHRGQDEEIVRSLRAQLMIESHEAVLLAGKLARLSDRRLSAAQRWLIGVIVLFFLNILVWLIWTYHTVVSKVIRPVERLQEGVQKVTAGDFTHQTHVRSDDEIGYFSLAFDQMTLSLKRSQDNLKGELRARTDAENKLREVNRELEKYAAKMKEMASALTVTEQRERRRLAQMLHDHLQQLLVASKISLSRLSHASTHEAMETNLKELGNLLEEAMASSRTLTVELSPPVLRDAGLSPAIDWLARWMYEKHELKVKIQREADFLVPGDDVKIFVFQAVRELLFNVVKHANTSQAFIHLYSQKDFLCVEIRDEGKGFDPVKKLANGKKRLDEAGALPSTFGLSSIHDRIGLLGGQFNIESAPGKGSRFTLCIPAAKVSRGQKMPQAVKRSARTKKKAVMRILVVDDHKIFRQGLIAMLSGQEDIEIVGEAGDGVEALKKASELKPDLVIMDISMPMMNGIEATHRIKAQFPDIDIIALSLHESQDMLQIVKNAGAAAYHNKGGPIEELIESIHSLNDPNAPNGSSPQPQ